MQPTIINNRIAGTRVSVYTIVPYLDGEWSQEAIAGVLNLSLDQVQAAIRYIKEHHDEVMAVHRRIEERNARGNPPEIEAKRRISHAKLQTELNRRRQQKMQEVSGVGHLGGQ